MTGAVAMSETVQVVLWHPHHGGYLDNSGDGYTRRISRAARFTLGDAKALMRDPANCHLKIEAVAAVPAVAPATRAPRRSDLSKMTQEELLRRAVKALRPTGGSQVPRWFVVMDALGLNSAGAINLCRRLQIDQNERTER